MTNIVILNAKTHKELRVLAGASARYGDAQRFVPVAVNEFAFLVPHYPIFFAKDSETGAFYCGAMLGIDEGENLFLADGGGMDGYRPLNLQRGPFFTAGSDIAIDLDHARIDAGGQPLFTDAGEPSDYLKSIMGLFQNLRPGLEQTKVFIETLMKARLVEPVDINLAFDDGTKRHLEGLYTVNQDALKKLPEAAIVDFFQRGYLQAIYLMIASLKQVPVLAQKKNAGLAR